MFLIDDLAKSFFKKKAAEKQAKAANAAEEANLNADFEQRSANESNREDDRLARMQGLAGQLTGARALPAGVVQSALKRRQSAVRKGKGVDRAAGLGWGMGADMAGNVGDFVGTVMSGGMSGALKGALGGGGGGNGLLSQASQIVQKPTDCPNGEC